MVCVGSRIKLIERAVVRINFCGNRISYRGTSSPTTHIQTTDVSIPSWIVLHVSTQRQSTFMDLIGLVSLINLYLSMCFFEISTGR